MIPPEVQKRAEQLLLEKFALARAWLDNHAVYLATTYESFIVHFVPGVKTMGVTRGYVLYADPVWLLSDPDINGSDGHEYLAADLLHECGHIMRDMDRLDAIANWFMGKGFDKKTAHEWANIAGDMPINQDILDQGLKMHKWVITPDTFDFDHGLTMEGYAQKLFENKKQVEEKLNGKSGKGGNGDKKGEQAQGKGSGGGKDDEQRKGRIGAGCCGGMGGNPNEELEKTLDQTVGRDEYDQERIQYETAEAIKEYQAANGMGSTPGFIVEKLPPRRKEKPNINWQRECKYLLRRCTGSVVRGGSDYSLRRPSKRSMMLGVIRPGLIDQKPVISIKVDSSASMGTKQLNSAKDVVCSVLEQLGIDQVLFQWADVVAHETPQLVSIKDIPVLDAVGRGGTSFVQPLMEEAARRPPPDLTIYITDGDGRAPDTCPPGLKVVWCIVPTPYGRRPADWGHLVVCSNDQMLRAPYKRPT